MQSLQTGSQKGAFGIERWNAGAGRFEVARKLTKRERQLFEPSDYTLPVDFTAGAAPTPRPWPMRTLQRSKRKRWPATQA